MSLSTSYQLINPSFFGEGRILFGNFTANTDCNPKTQKVGVRFHWWLTALALALLGKIETVQMSTGETLYLNKGSVEIWLLRHGENSQDTIAERIARVCKQTWPKPISSGGQIGLIRPPKTSLESREEIEVEKKRPVTSTPLLGKSIAPTPLVGKPTTPFSVLSSPITTKAKENEKKVEPKEQPQKPVQPSQQNAYSLPVTPSFTKMLSYDEIHQQLVQKRELESKTQELTKKYFNKWKAYAKRHEKLAKLRADYLESAQERQKEQKIFEYAKTHISKLEALIYTPEGELKNVVEEEAIRNRYSQWQKEEDPVCLREQAKKLRLKADTLEGKAKEAKLAEAQEAEDEAVANEGKWEKKKTRQLDYIKNMQKTLFPINSDSKKISFDEMLGECPEGEWKSKYVYHGTTISRAHYVRKNGFERSFPSGRTLDAGSGTYFALQPRLAFEGYAKKKEEGVITCSVNLKKVAKIKNYGGLYLLVEKYFLPLTSRYMNDNKEEILKALSAQGISPKPGYEDRNYIFQRHLTHEMTKLFFQKLGYEGIQVTYSDRAGCGYLAVFEPTEETVQVLSLEKSKECLKEERDRIEADKKQRSASVQG